MTENLIPSPKTYEAYTLLAEAERILMQDGIFENLEQLGGWSPAHYAKKLERERDELREVLRILAEHGEIEIQRLTKERDEAREELAK